MNNCESGWSLSDIKYLLGNIENSILEAEGILMEYYDEKEDVWNNVDAERFYRVLMKITGEVR